MARAKFVHEISGTFNIFLPYFWTHTNKVVHNIKPEATADYLDLIKEYKRVDNESSFEVALFGSWSVEVGELDSFIHIW